MLRLGGSFRWLDRAVYAPPSIPRDTGDRDNSGSRATGIVLSAGATEASAQAGIRPDLVAAREPIRFLRSDLGCRSGHRQRRSYCGDACRRGRCGWGSAGPLRASSRAWPSRPAASCALIQISGKRTSLPEGRSGGYQDPINCSELLSLPGASAWLTKAWRRSAEWPGASHQRRQPAKK